MNIFQGDYMSKEEMLQKLLMEAERQTRLLQSIDRKLKDTCVDTAVGDKEESFENDRGDGNRDSYYRSYGASSDESEKFQRALQVKNDEIGKNELRIGELNQYVRKLEAEKKQIVGERDQAVAGKKELKEKYKKLQEDYEDLAGQIQAKDRSISRLTGDYGRMKEERDSYAETVQKLTKERKKLETAKEKVQGELDRISGPYENLKKQQEALNSKYVEAVQRLNDTFGEGREYFEKYNEPDFLSEDTKEQMKQVFAHPENFESFICGCGSLDSSKLSSFWDTIRSSLMGGNEEDAQFLFNLFNYAMGLVNDTKVEPLYELQQTEEGEEYRTGLHSITPDSPAQGRVQEVLLPGFQRISDGNIIRKSLVVLG